VLASTGHPVSVAHDQVRLQAVLSENIEAAINHRYGFLRVGRKPRAVQFVGLPTAIDITGPSGSRKTLTVEIREPIRFLLQRCDGARNHADGR
jgi:hypothetical protein